MRTTLILCLLACGCGDDGGGGGGEADASTAPATLTISGTATRRESLNTNPAAGALVAAYKNSDQNTPVAMATTDAAGMYTMTVTTGGVAVDGYLKSTLTGFIDTYLYPPKPLDADFAGASINHVDSNTLDLLSGTLCGSLQDRSKGVIALLIVDAANMPVAGAMVSSTPTAMKYCYNSGGIPDKTKVMTDTDGIAYMANVTAGEVTVSATKSGLTFSSHKVNARAGVLTTTVIQP
jgi:hypothetical protein